MKRDETGDAEERRIPRVRRRTLSARGAYSSSGRRGEVRRSRRRRRKKLVFWFLLLMLAGVLAWGFWGMRRGGGEPAEEPVVELRVPSRSPRTR